MHLRVSVIQVELRRLAASIEGQTGRTLAYAANILNLVPCSLGADSETEYGAGHGEDATTTELAAGAGPSHRD